MGKVVWLDDEVMDKLKVKAGRLGIPFSNPNNVIRVILRLKPLPGPTHKPD